MKKFGILVFVFCMLCVCLGCSKEETEHNNGSGYESNEAESESTEAESESTADNENLTEITMQDYAVAPMSNAEKVEYLCEADNEFGTVLCQEPNGNRIVGWWVYSRCPLCSTEDMWRVDMDDVPTTNLGLQSFTWTEEVTCSNWSNHDQYADSEYRCTLLFTLQK